MVECIWEAVCRHHGPVTGAVSDGLNGLPQAPCVSASVK